MYTAKADPESNLAILSVSNYLYCGVSYIFSVFPQKYLKFNNV